MYRLVQESLTNAARHSRATLVKVEVRLLPDSSIELLVTDNGQGIKELTSQHRGFGLLGMQERVASLKGIFQIDSQPGSGVRIHICLPLEMA